jgi:hypothetical protein
MAVLQEYPPSLHAAIAYHLLGLRSLTLPQRDLIVPLHHLLLASELQEVSHGVGTTREHEYQGCQCGRVLIALREVECGWDDELPPDLVADPFLYGGDHLVGAETLDEQELLELI